MPKDDIIVSTTQDHLEVEGITRDLVILKSGAAALVMQVSAINFGLLSEEEQDATIYSYAGLLNSLSYPIQIMVKSDKKDISGYIEILTRQEQKLKDPILKNRMQSYRRFVEETIVQQNVLDKKFYVIIPYQPVTLTSTKEITEDFIKKALTDLEPKRDHLIKQFARIGLVAVQINSQNLTKLLSGFYNPEVKGQKFAPAKDYETPMVAPHTPQNTPITPTNLPANEKIPPNTPPTQTT